MGRPAIVRLRNDSWQLRSETAWWLEQHGILWRDWAAEQRCDGSEMVFGVSGESHSEQERRNAALLDRWAER